MRFAPVVLASTLLLLIGIMPATADQPVPIEASPAPGETALPEIGRTRGRVLCTALREIVPTAIRTTQHADVQFSSARSLLFDAISGSASGRPMLLRKIDATIVAMAKDVIKLKTLLDDPRVAAVNESAGSGAEKAHADVRAAVQALYESEARQLNALDTYVETGRREELLDEDEDSWVMKGALKDIAVTRGRPIAGRSTYLGGPPGYTNKLAEANDLDRWFERVTAVTTRREETASKIIVAAAALCR